MSRILVLLGTDHHPFDRLVKWADAWALSHPDDVVTVQHGYTQAPSHADGVAFFTPDELQRQVPLADIVVTHGGPGTVTDALRGGRRPLLLPRDPRRGEHVDGHQMRFAPWAAAKEMVTLINDPRELDDAVRQELRSPRPALSHSADRRALAAARLTQVLNDAAPIGPVLYIAGTGRSGSTIVERVLGQDPRIVPLGEVVHLWPRGIVRNELCGCGVPLRECPFWTEVGNRAFGGWDQLDLAHLQDLAGRVDRQRRLPKTALPILTPATRGHLLAYTSHYRRVYEAALAVSGAEVVIDSSKHPSLAMALSHHPGIDLRVLHLVRDSMGVTYSWSKSVRRPEAVRDEDAQMKQYSASSSGMLWLASNAETELLRTRPVPRVRLRYEDFVRRPQSSIDHVWAALELPGPSPSLVGADNTIDLAANHTAAGNPSRFATGMTHLRADRGWAEGLAAKDQRKISVLTGVLRATYGYGREP